MKRYHTPLLTVAILLGVPTQAVSSSLLRPIPASLWAMQASVPPGSNNTQALETVAPVGVPVGVGGGIVTGELAPGVPAPSGARSGSAGPIGSDGRMPGLPPGIPLGPPAAGPGGASGAGRDSAPMPGRAAPSNRVTPADVTRVETPIPKRLVCEVLLGTARTELPASGGEFRISAILNPPACIPGVSFGSTWIQVTDATSFRFRAEPNTSAVVREAMIGIGEASFYVRQQPPAQPGLAAAPGRLVFGVNKKGETETKTITGWTDSGAGAFTARAGHSWLSVTPRRSKGKQQAFDVTVRRNSGLGPGRYDTFVELTPAGSNTFLRIPVVVEVPGAY